MGVVDLREAEVAGNLSLYSSLRTHLTSHHFFTEFWRPLSLYSVSPLFYSKKDSQKRFALHLFAASLSLRCQFHPSLPAAIPHPGRVSVERARKQTSSSKTTKTTIMKSTRQNLMLKNILAAAVLGVAASVANAAPIVFTSNGTYTVPAGVTSIDYLVVGGGGGGGGQSGGGGGGGRFIEAFALAVSEGEQFSITIGVGGAGAPGANRGTKGGNSILSRTVGPAFTITSFGGGGGGGDPLSGGATGATFGSAGGNGWDNLAGTPIGINGGNGGLDGPGDRDGGGGGGAGGNGTNGSGGTTGGNGGAGALSVITGLHYAGGGGGATSNNAVAGLGGIGGGGKGGAGYGGFTPATAGLANRGGGGGGADDGAAAGGSGVVVIAEIVPEPGTMGLLGLASGALLLRRRRKN
ncbi:MAG: glycine-rich domain-containing protein [Bryobacteraceae bacterium]